MPDHDSKHVRSPQEELLQVIFDTFPSYVFITDYQARIVMANRTAKRLMGEEAEMVLRRLCGEVIHCLREMESCEECGNTPFCKECVVRRAVEAARSGKALFQQRAPMYLEIQGQAREMEFLVTSAPLPLLGRELILLVLEDVTEMVQLRRLLPMCASCKKIRNDNQYWEEVSSYLNKNAGLNFTHGYCPDCLTRLFPDAGSGATDDVQ